MNALLKVTDLEAQVLKNIAHSEYIDSVTPEELIGYPTWSFVATNQTKQLTGALGSCIKKGLVGGDTPETKSGNETCYLTTEGVEYLKSINFEF